MLHFAAEGGFDYSLDFCAVAVSDRMEIKMDIRHRRAFNMLNDEIKALEDFSKSTLDVAVRDAMPNMGKELPEELSALSDRYGAYAERILLIKEELTRSAEVSSFEMARIFAEEKTKEYPWKGCFSASLVRRGALDCLVVSDESGQEEYLIDADESLTENSKRILFDNKKTVRGEEIEIASSFSFVESLSYKDVWNCEIISFSDHVYNLKWNYELFSGELYRRLREFEYACKKLFRERVLAIDNELDSDSGRIRDEAPFHVLAFRDEYTRLLDEVTRTKELLYTAALVDSFELAERYAAALSNRPNGREYSVISECEDGAALLKIKDECGNTVSLIDAAEAGAPFIRCMLSDSKTVNGKEYKLKSFLEDYDKRSFKYYWCAELLNFDEYVKSVFG